MKRQTRPIVIAAVALLAGLATGAGCSGPARGLVAEREGEGVPGWGRPTDTGYREFVREGPTPEEIDYPWPPSVEECGPPPPGYWRITGDPVPGWTPEMMQGGADGGAWAPLGPRPITNEYWSGNAHASGRVVSLVTAGQTVYIASASGGVWKSTDAGATWGALTDELSTLNHGALALHPTNPEIVYAGTGEYTTNSGGDGLFRSLDGGATWARIATTAQVGSNCSRVVIDPVNPQRVYVSGSSGMHRSTDGGATWAARITGSCSDVALNPSNPLVVYTAKANDGVYRSVDGGTTNTKLTGGLPTAGMRRIVLAVAPGNGQVVYAAFANTSNGLLGLHKTVDGGDTWTQLTATPNFPQPQAWYDMCLAVSPLNENIIFAGGVFPSYAVAGIIRSLDGGLSWTDITVGAGGGQVHPDIQCLHVAPDGTLWTGSDGGVWKTANQGLSWTNCNAALALTQHYQIALHPTDPARMIGGTQDNGTVQRGGSDPWPQVLSGDGGFAAYDKANTSRRYVTYVYLAVYRQTSGGTTNISGPWSSDSRQFIAPLIMHPTDSRTLLGGTTRVWRTNNADASSVAWTAISPTTVANGATLTALAYADSEPATIYAGGSSGRIGVTTNDGANWLDRSGGPMSTGAVSDFAVSPVSPGVVYVSFAAGNGTRVARSDNAGASWTNLTGPYPVGITAKSLAVDWRTTPPTLWVGSGSGVYSSADHGATWVKDGMDFPNVNIGDLQIDAGASPPTLTAGTYGRGAWRRTLPTPPCYPNCDGSTTAPVLNVGDFSCFLTRFAAGDPYANCDSSVVAPVFNVADFSCFLERYAAGCP